MQEQKIICFRGEWWADKDKEVEEGAELESKEDGKEEADIGEMVELSINSVVGLTTPKTMTIKGKICQ